MMLKLVTVAAAVALAQAKPKTYIFNAGKQISFHARARGET